jgi:cytochrome c biogenesis protein CcmG/thiol:disulfide interchange protein DsbE
MSPRLSALAGLVSGVLVAVVVLGGIVALAPDPVPASTPVPSVVPSIVAPSPPASAGVSASPDASPVTSGDAAFHVGEVAPPLVVPQVGGGTIDLANLKGQPVWVNFMGTYCPPCVDEFPLMNGFAARYAEEGLVILAIDVKEEEGVVAAFAESLGATFPLGLDADGSAQATWEAAALPVHFWIDKEGIVRDGALGGIGPDVMAQGLQTILPDVTVTAS